jgi:hypothetical protein
VGKHNLFNVDDSGLLAVIQASRIFQPEDLGSLCRFTSIGDIEHAGWSGINVFCFRGSGRQWRH